MMNPIGSRISAPAAFLGRDTQIQPTALARAKASFHVNSDQISVVRPQTITPLYEAPTDKLASTDQTNDVSAVDGSDPYSRSQKLQMLFKQLNGILGKMKDLAQQAKEADGNFSKSAPFDAKFQELKTQLSALGDKAKSALGEDGFKAVGGYFSAGHWNLKNANLGDSKGIALTNSTFNNMDALKYVDWSEAQAANKLAALDGPHTGGIKPPPQGPVKATIDGVVESINNIVSGILGGGGVVEHEATLTGKDDANHTATVTGTVTNGGKIDSQFEITKISASPVAYKRVSIRA